MEIKERRLLLKLTQEEVARQIGVTQAAVAIWEAGEAMPRSDKLPELARVLNCEINDLFEANESEVAKKCP